ncbi:cytochrome P450 [Actinomadura physcomitrii]|nr:cytochrome P450 [Actinomadura physcomitrii]
MAPRIRELVDDAVDRLLDAPRPANLHRLVSRPIPSQVICLLLGIDYAAHELFESLTERLLDMTTSAEAFQEALRDVEDFIRAQVAEQERDPGDGVLGRLLVERVRTGQLTHEQLVGFAMLLLIGGHETTAKMITLGMLTFLTEPEQAERVRLRPDLMPGAIEEILRIHAITDLTVPKLAARDMSVAGCPINAGEGILPLTAAANHDPDVFPDPDRFDPARGDRRHLTFGLGVHACLGQNLARAEMEAVFSALLRRVPSLRLAVPVSELEPDRNAIVWGLKDLPVTW